MPSSFFLRLYTGISFHYILLCKQEMKSLYFMIAYPMIWIASRHTPTTMDAAVAEASVPDSFC